MIGREVYSQLRLRHSKYCFNLERNVLIVLFCFDWSIKFDSWEWISVKFRLVQKTDQVYKSDLILWLGYKASSQLVSEYSWLKHWQISSYSWMDLNRIKKFIGQCIIKSKSVILIIPEIICGNLTKFWKELGLKPLIYVQFKTKIWGKSFPS